MIKDDYNCDGQIELTDYLKQLEAETEKCNDCIYYKQYKCVRYECHKISQSEGWQALWYNERGHVHGKWPTNETWQPVETLCEGENYYICEGEAKDKTFKWPKDTIKKFNDRVIAWRYKGES